MNIRLYKSEEFFKYFNKEITFSDKRSKTMPVINQKGTVVCIRLDSVELRVNNDITQWYSFTNTNITFNIE